MGAASIRIMLGTFTDGHLTYEEKHRFSNEIKTINGHERWNIELITKEIKKGIQQALTTADGSVQSIAVDSWGVDFVLLDADGNLLDDPVAYRDARTKGMQEKWSHEMSPADTFSKTGINFYDFNTLFHLLSIRNSDLIPRIDTILFMPCYINYILSGQMLNETTIASTSQLLNVKGNSINSEIAAKLNLDPKVFGRIIPAGTTLGQYREADLVTVCAHDTACAVTAIPAEEDEFTFIASGTWCIVGTVSAQPGDNKICTE